MDRQELLWTYQDAVIEIYKEYQLTSLRGLNSEFIVKKKQIVAWHSDVTNKSSIKNSEVFNYYQNFDDLLFCSDKLLYFTALLFLYRPFINNPIKDGFQFASGIVYPNKQNLEGKRYGMFSDIASQKAYNYWDRIGDLIASLFPEQIKQHNVYFPTAIEAIPKEFHTNDNYLWLNEFRQNEYLELNKIRKKIVHYTTSDTDFKHKHLKVSGDKEAMQELQDERELIADFYRNHINLTLTGFYKTLSFIEDINPKLFPETKYA